MYVSKMCIISLLLWLVIAVCGLVTGVSGEEEVLTVEDYYDEDDMMVEEEDADEMEDVEYEDDDKTELEAVADEGDGQGLVSSVNASTTLVLTPPCHEPGKIPARAKCKAVIGFRNHGDGSKFLVSAIEGALHYPGDFSFIIQNLTQLEPEQGVGPSLEVSFLYPFSASDALIGRPFIFCVRVYYTDLGLAEGEEPPREEVRQVFMDAAINATMEISEPVDGVDADTVLIYLFGGALASLVLLLLHQAWHRGAGGGNRDDAPCTQTETGTAAELNVDYEWIPQDYYKGFNKQMSKTLPQKKRIAREVAAEGGGKTQA